MFKNLQNNKRHNGLMGNIIMSYPEDFVVLLKKFTFLILRQLACGQRHKTAMGVKGTKPPWWSTAQNRHRVTWAQNRHNKILHGSFYLTPWWFCAVDHMPSFRRGDYKTSFLEKNKAYFSLGVPVTLGVPKKFMGPIIFSL